MAFNFTPLEYNPFEYNNNLGSAPRYYDGRWFNVPTSSVASNNYAVAGPVQDWERRVLQSQMDQQQAYSGDQFQSLFDAVNNMGNNPAMSGEMFNNAPRYSPYEGTREQFTTGTNPGYRDTFADDGTWIDPDGPTTFNQQGYLDAQFNNINDYLGKMGSFFGNMGSGQETQALLANMQGQGPRPVMPSVGSSFNPSAGGVSGTSGNNPFQSFGALKSGGWGTAPTSLFGAGAGNANNT
jgi:hypothetical protein